MINISKYIVCILQSVHSEILCICSKWLINMAEVDNRLYYRAKSKYADIFIQYTAQRTKLRIKLIELQVSTGISFKFEYIKTNTYDQHI